MGALSGLADISVTLNSGSNPHCKIKDGKVYAIETFPVVPFAKNDEDDFQIGRGTILHESSHVLFAPDIGKAKKKLINDGCSAEDVEDFRQWANIFADCNNEYKLAELFPHLKEHLLNLGQRVNEAKPELRTTDNPFMQVLQRCDGIFNSKPEYPADMDPKLISFCDKTIKEFKKKKILSAPAKKLVTFTKKTWKRWQDVKDKHEQQKGGSVNDMECAEKELGDAIAKGDEKGQDEAQKKIDELYGNTSKILYKDDIDKDVVRDNPMNVNTDYNEMSIDDIRKMLQEQAEQGKKIKTQTGNSWGNDIVKDDNVIKAHPSEYCKRNVSYDKDKAYKIGKKVNRGLKRKVALQEDFEKKQRSGRMDLDLVRRQISKNGIITSNTIFQRLNDFTRGGEWAVKVLIDCSGSMGGGTKMPDAKQALATLGYAFNGLPNLHYSFTGFTADFATIDLVIKRFKDRKLNMKNLDILCPVGGNHDGHNIRSAIREFKPYRRLKKLMIVISDGQPAYGNGLDDTKKAVDLATRLGIKVIGIGIEGCTEKSLAHIYPTRYMFKNTEHLAEDLLNLILNALGDKRKSKLIRNKWEL